MESEDDMLTLIPTAEDFADPHLAVAARLGELRQMHRQISDIARQSRLALADAQSDLKSAERLDDGRFETLDNAVTWLDSAIRDLDSACENMRLALRDFTEVVS